MSNNNNFTNTWQRARPVTKLEITSELMDIEELYQSYRMCRKHNKRSRDMVMFDMSLYGRLYKLCEAINSRTYTPSANYTFIHYRPKAREVFAAEPELKVIMAYVDRFINQPIDKRLSPRAFNNRIGKGTHAAVNQVIDDIYTCSEGYSKDCWIIKVDLKGYFPNINQDRAFALVSDLIDTDCDCEDKDELRYLVERVCYSNPQENCEKRSQLYEWNEIASYKSLFSKPFGIGGAIGFLFWQIMSNYYLCDIDKWAIGNITPYYVRFVDDIVMVTDRKDYTLAMIGELRKRLAEVDVELHPKKFYCQHATKGLEFLGYHIARGRVHVNNKIAIRAEQASRKARAPNYMERMNSYLGILKGCNEVKVMTRILDNAPKRYIKDYDKWKVLRRNKSDNNGKDNKTRIAV